MTVFYSICAITGNIFFRVLDGPDHVGFFSSVFRPSGCFLPPKDISFGLLQPEITAFSGHKTELLGKKNFTVSSG